MSIIDLVARWTTENCHMSIRLSMCGDYHYDNTLISQKLQTELWSIKCSRSAVFPEIHLCENKTKRSLVQNFFLFLQCFCVSNKKKSDGKKLTTTQHLPDIECGTLPTKILNLIKTENA